MTPCKRGHTGVRNKSGECRACKRACYAAYRAAHLEEERAREAAYRAAHRDELRAYAAAYSAAYRTRKPEVPRALTAKRRALRLSQRCVCCSDAKIALLYLAARPWGRHAEVDHRVPLALGGHHCARNLVLLPTVAHAEKTKQDQRAIAEARRRSRLLQQWGTP